MCLESNMRGRFESCLLSRVVLSKEIAERIKKVQKNENKKENKRNKKKWKQ